MINFKDIYGDTDEGKFVEFIIKQDFLPFTIDDVINSTGIDRENAERFITLFKKKHFIKKDSQNGFILNSNDAVVKLTVKLFAEDKKEDE